MANLWKTILQRQLAKSILPLTIASAKIKTSQEKDRLELKQPQQARKTKSKKPKFSNDDFLFFIIKEKSTIIKYYAIL